MTIGQSMKSCRKAHGLTQRQLADLAGVSHHLVWSSETDNTVPSIVAVEAMADVLGVSIDQYIGRI